MMVRLVPWGVREYRQAVIDRDRDRDRDRDITNNKKRKEERRKNIV